MTGALPVTVGEFVTDAEGLTDEHVALRQAVRDFLHARFSTEGLVARVEAGQGFDREAWSLMARDLGLQGLAISEADGGAGYGWREQSIVLHEMGRVLYGGPYWSTVALAAPMIQASGDPAASATWLPRIAAGECIATAAVDAAAGGVVAQTSADAVLLRGQLPRVVSGAEADLVLLVAREADGTESLFALEPAQGGVSVLPLETLDLLRPFATLELTGAVATRVGLQGAGRSLLEAGVRYGRLGLAAEQVGGAEAALEAAVAYAKVREQFGRPIGSFQAIKHTCTEMLLELESCRVLTEHAAWVADQRPELLEPAAAAAGAAAGEAFPRIAYDALHIHGGLGFTWEHPIHLYFRRSRSDELLLGTAASARELLATWVCG